MQAVDLVEEFLALPVYAVVGASRDTDKYGYKIFKDLLAKGYRAYPVNPKAADIDGLKCYASLADLPEKPDVVDIVVPPKVTERVVEECARLGFKRVWMQPGAESEAAINFCKTHNIQVIHSQCVMALSGPRRDSSKEK